MEVEGVVRVVYELADHKDLRVIQKYFDDHITEITEFDSYD